MNHQERIFFRPLAKSVVGSFAASFGVKITFYSPNLDEWFVRYGDGDERDYCTLIQQHLGLRPRCLQSDWSMCRQCGKRQHHLRYQCHAGMTEIVLPVRLEDEIVSYAMVGRFRMYSTVPEGILDEWRGKGLDPKALTSAFLARPLYSVAQVSRIIDLFQLNLQMLCDSQSLTLHQSDLVEQVFAYIDSHITEKIRLDSVCNSIGRSASTITHTLKNRLGLSFKDVVIMQKIMRFETIIRNDPGLNIGQAAALVGYEDPLYFSRLYKSKRGESPKDFRNLIRSTRDISPSTKPAVGSETQE